MMEVQRARDEIEVVIDAEGRMEEEPGKDQWRRYLHSPVLLTSGKRRHLRGILVVRWRPWWSRRLTQAACLAARGAARGEGGVAIEVERPGDVCGEKRSISSPCSCCTHCGGPRFSPHVVGHASQARDRGGRPREGKRRPDNSSGATLRSTHLTTTRRTAANHLASTKGAAISQRCHSHRAKTVPLVLRSLTPVHDRLITISIRRDDI